MLKICTIVTMLYLLSASVAAAESISGIYSTVSESDCTISIAFFANGKGTLVESCAAENGTTSASKKTEPVAWTQQADVVIVRIKKKPVKFHVVQTLSCQIIGKEGSAPGIVGDGMEFWKEPIACQ